MTTGRTKSARPVLAMGPLLLAIGVLLAGCGSSSGPSSSSASAKASAGGASASSDNVAAAKASAAAAATAPTTIPITAPLSKAPPKGKLVVMVQDATSTPGVELFAGVQEAAAALGWTAKSIKFNSADLTTFNTGLLQALTMKADYVVNSGIPITQLSKSTVAKYKAAGVKMLITTSPLPTSGPFLPTLSGERARILAGKKLADWFVGDSNGTGHAMIVNITTYPVLTLFANSFADHTAQTCPSCKTQTIKVTIGDFISGALASKAIATLRSDRSIKYAVFDNAVEVGGFDSKLKAAGLNDVKILAHSIDPITVKSLQSGQGAAYMAYSFRYDGWDAIDTFARDSVGDKPSGDENVGLQRLVTKDNVSELPADALYRGPDDALAQFKKLWLVS